MTPCTTQPSFGTCNANGNDIFVPQKSCITVGFMKHSVDVYEGTDRHTESQTDEDTREQTDIQSHKLMKIRGNRQTDIQSHKLMKIRGNRQTYRVTN